MKILKNITRKPWGAFYDLAEKKQRWHLKILVIKKGQRLSLQTHTHRSELWIVAEGKAKVQKGNKVFIVTPQKSIFIEKKEKHHIAALTDAVILVEISFGNHKEKDITRFADDYGRS
ncbi:MAG: phosphomannose isomerase type II C-terminal cupin domain [Parcubacteria group bacterium]|nr:phosphomannose isomerase type II C-terminal cupin domain [Parcubacteria group bacterium]